MFGSLLMFNYRRLGRLIVSSRNCATFKVLSARRSLLNGGVSVNSELDRILIEAQELVHYSILVLNRTRTEVIDSLRSVYGGRDHHLLKATDAAYYNNGNIQMRELILLLMSKITQHQYETVTMDSQPAFDSDIVQKQLTITEIIELIYKTNLLHQSIANHRVGESSRLKAEDWNIHYNNKLAILFGDFYVGRAWALLGRLRPIDVNLLMSQGIVDFTQGQFIMQNDIQLPFSPSPSPSSSSSSSSRSNLSQSQTSLPPKEPGNSPLSIWENRHYLMNASLPGHACQSISVVADLNLFFQEAAFKFGKNFSLCWQILTEMEPFLLTNDNNNTNLNNKDHSNSTATFTTTTTPELVIDVMSLPVLLQMVDKESITNSKQTHQEILIAPDSTINPINDNQAIQIDIDKFYKSITGGPIIERIRLIRNQYADEALNAINCFSKCDASCALINILNAIKET